MHAAHQEGKNGGQGPLRATHIRPPNAQVQLRALLPYLRSIPIPSSARQLQSSLGGVGNELRPPGGHPSLRRKEPIANNGSDEKPKGCSGQGRFSLTKATRWSIRPRVTVWARRKYECSDCPASDKPYTHSKDAVTAALWPADFDLVCQSVGDGVCGAFTASFEENAVPLYSYDAGCMLAAQ
jgi:hypothetical protein